jgi:hypothetical protein
MMEHIGKAANAAVETAAQARAERLRELERVLKFDFDAAARAAAKAEYLVLTEPNRTNSEKGNA